LINLLKNKILLNNKWSDFAKTFNFCYLKKKYPVIVGYFNGNDVEIKLERYRKGSLKKFYTKIIVNHTNKNQQKIRILKKSNFSKLSLLHRIHENLGYSYNDYEFLDNHMIFSFTKLDNSLDKEIMTNFNKNIRHELKIDNSKIILNEPGIILDNERLLSLVYFLTELSIEISKNKFNQKKEVVLR
jgi:hypothetical protein